MKSKIILAIMLLIATLSIRAQTNYLLIGDNIRLPKDSTEKYNFGESQQEHLLVTQFINALIAQRMENEKGFSEVRELLEIENISNNKDAFFKTLERITGINEKNFNKEAAKLINEAMKNR